MISTTKDEIGILIDQRLSQRILSDGDRVFFKAHSRYGLAEFFVCLRYSRFRHRLERAFIIPLQQENAAQYFEIDLKSVPDAPFSVSSWHHKGVEYPHIWTHVWCHDHGGPGLRLYVPPTSTNFVVSVSKAKSGITFDL